MYASTAMAFLHHLAAFTLVAALAVEVALFKPPLSLLQARRLLRTDLIFGVAATVVLVVGMLRVAFFEKGREYYWHDLYFLIKFGAFLAAALISIKDWDGAIKTLEDFRTRFPNHALQPEVGKKLAAASWCLPPARAISACL